MATSNIRIKKICKWCGKEFEAQKASTQFCSKRCAEHAYKEKKRQEKKKQVETAEVERVTSGKEKKLQDYQYLSVDELKRLAATPCDIDVLKRASLFSCLTGLRISDILNLKWENLETAPDQGYCIRIRTQKTQTEAILPISYEAIELCGEKSTGKVFKGLTRSMVNYPLKKWIKRAQSEKSVHEI